MISPPAAASGGSQMSYGIVTVTPDPMPTWDEFVAAGTTGERKRDYQLLHTSVRQEGAIEPVESRMRIGSQFSPNCAPTFRMSSTNTASGSCRRCTGLIHPSL